MKKQNIENHECEFNNVETYNKSHEILIPEEDKEANAPSVKPKNLVNIKENIVSTYDGALDYAHQKGIKSLIVEPVQLPSPDNGFTAVCKAKLIMTDGSEFQDVADATPENTPAGCRDSLVRIASTRAKNRAFHDACNIPQVLTEQFDKVFDAEAVPVQMPTLGNSGSNPFTVDGFPRGVPGGKVISDKQKSFIEKLASGKGKDVDDIAQHRFGRPLEALSTKEADSLIKGLRGD